MGTCCDNNEKFDELTQKYQTVLMEKKKLERELRTLTKRYEINKLNISTQANLKQSFFVNKEMAEQASRSKSNFLARMSHEIRTPLGAIMGMAELSLREELPEAAVEYVSTIIQSGKNLLDIINDILDLSKIETGKLEIVVDDYEITSLISDVINIIKPKAYEAQLSFMVDVSSRIPCGLKGDVVRIRQILLNLLSNAVKYTEDGYVKFSVNAEKIDNNNTNLIVTIQDSGRGIKKEDISKLFDEYTRLDMSINKNTEGTGLGLAITNNLISAMGGSITVESEPGEGTVFTVVLPQEVVNKKKITQIKNKDAVNVLIYERREVIINPISRAMSDLDVKHKLVSSASEFFDELAGNQYTFAFIEAALYESAGPACERAGSDITVVVIAEYGDTVPAKNVQILTAPVFSVSCADIIKGSSADSSKLSKGKSPADFISPDSRVLLVDDISTNLIIAEGLMQPYNMQIDHCYSGVEALEAVNKNKYDIIFMDHMMPEMDGIEATKRIREMGKKDPYYADVPIVALTANTILGSREMYLKSGFSDFISKPIDTVKLGTVLSKWIPAEKQIAHSVLLDNIDGYDGSAVITDIIDGINIKKAVKLTGGTLEYFYEALASFYLDVSARIGLIEEAVTAKEWTQYITYVHAIRSASANLGAEDVSRLASDLETAGVDNDWKYINKNNDAFIVSLEKLLENIKTALAANDAKKEDENETDMDENIQDEMNRLKSSLESFSVDNVNLSIDKLLKQAKTDEDKEKVRTISLHILKFEYDEALKLI